MNGPSSHPDRNTQLDPFTLAAAAPAQRPAPRDEVFGYGSDASVEFPVPCAAAEAFGCVDWFCYPEPPRPPARSNA